jgi:hypothetical protein
VETDDKQCCHERLSIFFGNSSFRLGESAEAEENWSDNSLDCLNPKGEFSDSSDSLR